MEIGILWLLVVPVTVVSILWGVKVVQDNFYYDDDWKASFLNYWWMRASFFVFVVSEVISGFKGFSNYRSYKISGYIAAFSLFSLISWFLYNYINGSRARKRRKTIKSNINV